MKIEDEIKEFHKELDDDKGLKSKRQLVTYISLVILAINLSGATIQEANTFLFKIQFLRPEGLNALLAISLLFCSIRYFNYSYRYDIHLGELWKNRFLKDDRILFFDDLGDEYQGLLSPAINNDFNGLYGLLRNGEISELRKQYRSSLFSFRKAILFHYTDQYGQACISKCKIEINKLGFFNWLKVFLIEWVYRLGAYLTQRETLDLRAPYLLTALAISTFFFEQDHEVLEILIQFFE